MVNAAVRTLNPAEASWPGSRIFASLVRDDEGSGVSERQWQGRPAAVHASRIFASLVRDDEGRGWINLCVRLFRAAPFWEIAARGG
jgi:hypothetical protein